MEDLWEIRSSNNALQKYNMSQRDVDRQIISLSLKSQILSKLTGYVASSENTSSEPILYHSQLINYKNVAETASASSNQSINGGSNNTMGMVNRYSPTFAAPGNIYSSKSRSNSNGDNITSTSTYKIAMLKDQFVRADIKGYKSVDICFVVDCTRSMQTYLNTIVNNIKEIVRQVKEHIDRMSIRLSFVGYRDFGDAEVATYSFSEDTEDFKKHVSTIKAKGGGDGPEDVLDGLYQVSELEWFSRTKILFHIADEPVHNHGSVKYNTSCDDRAHPKGYTVENVLKKLQEKMINYYFFVKINNSTDTMTNKFASLYNNPNANFNFKVLNMGTDVTQFLPMVTQSIMNSINAMSRNYQ